MTAPHADLDDRVMKVYGALGQRVVLRKGLALGLSAQGPVPRYVSEFLLAQQPEASAVAAIADYLERHHPLPRDRNLWRHRLVQEGALRIVDRLDVVVDVQDGSHSARIGSLNLVCRVPSELAADHPSLLSGGVWGRIDLEWAPIGDDVPATVVRDFRPVQVGVSLEQFLEGRHYFTATEWIDLLLTSAGYDPESLIEGLPAEERLRRKLLLLVRLAPLAESSLHLLELGPKNTGKTYLARNIGPDSFVISGGRATPANLFVHLTTGVPGLLAQRRLVAFDEIARLSLGSPEIVAALKDFLESGQFSRGRHEIASDCSVVLLGNIDVEGGLPSRRYRHLCEPLPTELRDSAFIDRLHGYLPGWELPKLGRDSFAQGFGFVSDYFGEVLVRLRSVPFGVHYQALTREYPLLPSMTRRDATAVERMAHALLKLVFPTGPTGDDRAVVEAVLALAGELRQRIHDQLCRLAPGEFQPRAVGFGHVPVPTARDLLRPAQSSVRAARIAGETLFLDREIAGEEGGGKIRHVEATLLGSGRGLKIQGRMGVDAVESVRVAHSFLLANARALRVPLALVQERAIALQVAEGETEDGASLALPAFLAMVSALREEPFPMPVVAVGCATLHGHLEVPADLPGRLGALLLSNTTGLLVLPILGPSLEREARRIVPDWQLVLAADLPNMIRELGL